MRGVGGVVVLLELYQEEMKERMTAPKVAVSGGVLEERRDFLAEENMIIGSVTKFEAP